MTRIQPIVVVTVLSACATDAAWASQEQAQKRSVDERVRALIRLRREKYIRARAELLAEADVENALVRLSGRTRQWDVALECEALLYRLRDPERARLFDKYHQVPEGGWGPGFRPARRRSFRGYHSPYIWELLSCFGREALPVLAEHLLYTKDGINQGTVAALACMRDPRAVNVLIRVSRNVYHEGPEIRGSCVWELEQCLRGFEARRYGVPPTEHTPLSRMFPKLRDIMHLSRPRDLQAFQVTGEVRKRVLKKLVTVLRRDADRQVRAFAVRALGHGDASVIPALTRSLTRDPSAWIRAWCAVSLKKIGGEEATNAIREATAKEEYEEVLAVMEGKRTPINPESGLPEETIVIRRSRW